MVGLKKGREKSVLRRHPWVFSGAISNIEGDPAAGDVVRVNDHAGAFLAWGYFNPASQIQVRLLDGAESARIDDAWWRRRLEQAIDRRRQPPGPGETNMYRLVHAEADGLPGFVVDRYGGYLVLQALTAGIERVKPLLCGLLGELLKPEGIFERSDGDGRRLEGLAAVTGSLSGTSPPPALEVDEGGLRFLVDIASGHKTGFYIDQRENRRSVARYARGRNVLDLFCYSGGFGIHALSAGAGSVTMVDSSSDALALARRNVELNAGTDAPAELVEGNAFNIVRTYRDAARTFDMIVVDPPRFAQTRAQAAKAERAYKDINLVAVKLLSPGGILATFSCSGAVGFESFSRVVAWSSLDAGRNLQIVERLAQSCDHPVNPLFPESEYLTGLVCRVD
ncbi:MAG: class I SAM-dependent rRNA methyltransferase [Candidatus Krumholzibacteriia bacterium]